MIPVGLTWAALIVAVAAHAWAWRTRRRPASVPWLLLGALALRFFAAGDNFLHAWDERYHALVASNLVSHPLAPTLYDDPVLPYDVRDWTQAHAWLHKPPLALWLMALSIACLGANELAVRLPSLLLGTAAVWATYRIGTAWKGHTVGLTAACFHSVNAFLVLLAAGWFATDHVDTALVSLTSLAVAVAIPGGVGAFAALGAFTGLALLTKSPTGVLPLAVAAAWHLGRLNNRTLAARLLLASTVAVLVVLPWTLYSAVAFPAEAAAEHAYTLRHLFEPLEGHGHSALYHLARMPRIFGEPIYLALAWFAARFFTADRASIARAVALWIVIPYAVFSLAVSKMPAYVMIAAPAVFLVQAAFCCWLAERRQTRGAAARWVSVLLLAALAVAPLRILINDLRLLRPYDRNPAWAAELRSLGARLAGRRAVLFGSAHPIEAMFYTSQPAYAFVPDRATMEALTRRGYQIFVYQPNGGWRSIEPGKPSGPGRGLDPADDR